MRTVRKLAALTAGEKIKVDVQFHKTEVDLTGFAVDVRVTRDDVELDLAGGVAWLDITKGQCRVTFGEGDIDVAPEEERSRYRMEVWAGDGTERIASLLIVFDVYQHVGAASPGI